MHFVNPLFLIGLVAIAAPIVVHLFNFRRFKRIYFTNVRFIDELQQKTQKQSRLKHLLVLFFRILAIAFLVIAFAQPYVPVTGSKINQDARNAVSIYVDNSFSMEASATKGSLLEEARRKALEITAAFKPSDVFQLITNDFEGTQQRWVSRDEFIEMVNDVKVSPASRKLSEVISRQKDLLATANTHNRSSFLVSDFQKSMVDFENVKKDSGLTSFLVPLNSGQINNVYIDSCWFESPLTQLSQQLRLLARVKNSSETDYEKVPVKLMINGKQRALASFDCKSGESVEIPLTYTAAESGYQQAYLEISDYPVTFDDVYYFSYHVGESIPVLCIYEKEENVYLNTLFGKDSAILYQSVNVRNIDYSNLKSNNLIILNSLQNLSSGLIRELQKFLEQGGSIVVFLSEKPDESSWNQFLSANSAGFYGSLDTVKSRLSGIDPEMDLLKGVFESVPENMDLPYLFDHFRWRFASQSSNEALLSLENGDPFLLRNKIKDGTIYIFPFPLNPEYTNLMKHALFVPLMFKMAMLSQAQTRLSYVIGKDEAIIINDSRKENENVFKISRDRNGLEFIPEVKPMDGRLHVFPHDQVKEAGNYNLTEGGERITGLSYNYDRLESDLSFSPADELITMSKKAGLYNFYTLESKEKPISMEITSFTKGLRYWKLFVILSLLFFAAELALLRFWK